MITLGFSTYLASEGALYHAVASPIFIGGERLGTLFLYKDHGWYDMDDIILVEYAVSVIGLELMRSLSEEANASDQREQVVRGALEAMTTSERQAAAAILDQVRPGEEALVVTSRVAEEIQIARSVVVNAVRKLEGAGIITTHSAGVKGTRVKVINDVIFSTDLF